MVFQQFALLPWRSVVENVALGLELAGEPKEKRLAKAREVLATVNLQDWAEKKVSELSGGMQQRVGLARAFATDAEILLMDEPFSALDPLIRNRLQDELLQLQEKMHCTIVFVSHDLEEAVKLGNTITIMEGGRIVQTGRPEDIVLRPANGYVADFVAHLNPLSVLTAADAMVADAGPGDPARMLAAGGAARATRCRSSPTSDAPVWVGRDGATEGRISPRAVCAMLARSGDARRLSQGRAGASRWTGQRRETRTGTGRAIAADRAPERCSQKQRNETRQNTLQIPGCHPVTPTSATRAHPAGQSLRRRYCLRARVRCRLRQQSIAGRAALAPAGFGLSIAATGTGGPSHAEPDPGPAPRHLDGVGRAGQQRLLHRHARPAAGEEDGELRRAGGLSPLLRRRARHARLGDDLLPLPRTSARRHKGAGEVGETVFAVPPGSLALLARAAGGARGRAASPRTRASARSG